MGSGVGVEEAGRKTFGGVCTQEASARVLDSWRVGRGGTGTEGQRGRSEPAESVGVVKKRDQSWLRGDSGSRVVWCQ